MEAVAWGRLFRGELFRANCPGVKAREQLSRGWLSMGYYSGVVVRGRSPGLIVLRGISWGGGNCPGGWGVGGGSYLAGDFIESFQLMVSVLNVFKRKLLNLVFSKALPRNQGYFCFIQITSQMVLWTALFINLLMILIY